MNGWGDPRGYHLAVARSEGGYAWREVAVLRPAGLDASSWTGYQCVTGDGRYAAVAVLPMEAVNRPAARDRGAFGYGIDLVTGTVHALVTGVALKYHSPGCGIGHTATFTASLGIDQQQTRVVTTDLAKGAVTGDVTVTGQVTSVVPTPTGPVGAAGRNLVQVIGKGAAGQTRRLAVLDGLGYDVRPEKTGVALLTLQPGGRIAHVERVDGKGAVTSLGSGPVSDLGLFYGRDGRPVVTGSSSLVASSGLVTTAAKGGGVWGASLLGRVLLSDGESSSAGAKDIPGRSSAASATPTVRDAARGSVLPTRAPSGSAKVVTAVALQPGAGGAGTAGTSASRKAAAKTSATTSTGTSHASTKPVKAAAGGTVSAAAAQTPKCAVPRLAENRQVLQPYAAQVDWAVQLAEQGLLTGSSYTRPAGFANLGLAAYAPNTDFGRIALKHPAGDTWDTVPRSVYEAIMSQESNWSQASWHALPGIAGGPLISDYYGAAGTISKINYAAADCGYGIGQVTSGMATADTTFSANGKTKIAVDYQENISAGLQILQKTWNQLYDGGILANGGNPRYLENWYFAAWAYNTGVQPNAANGNTTGCTPSPTCTGVHGTWGLGWTNNPANPDYPPNRAPYLKTTYADAAHPGNWPYQERILGWMGSPIIRFGAKAYAGPNYHGGQSWLQVPAWQSFCTMAGNLCDPNYVNTSNPSLSHCTLSDRQCWWHDPVTWVTACTTTCATSSYAYGTGSSEPAGGGDPHPPTCTLDTAKVPTTADGPPIVVDESASQPPLNLVGCGTRNWSQGGTFTYAYGTNANGDPIGAIDTHQLGAGFGGHILFTHTEDGKNADLVNTGTWTPTLPKLQYYTVKIHLPATGASATSVVYQVYPGGGASPWKIRVNQHWGSEEWVTIGTFAMQNGGSVTLSNTSTDTSYSDATYSNYDVAFDAIAFVQKGGTPGKPIGGPPQIIDAPKGSNPAWVQCGCVRRTAGDPVDTSTGAFGETWTDLAFPGRGMPIAFSRSYASAIADPNGPNGSAAVNGPFGYGWTFSYGMSAVTDATTGAVTIKQEDGSRVAFAASGGTYTPVLPRNFAALSKSGSTYTYTRRGAQLYTFDVASGHLTSLTDRVGSMASPAYATTLSYDSAGNLAKVTDPAGRTLSVTWTGSHITQVADSAGRVVSYGYDAAGNLSDVYGVGTTRSPSLKDDDHTVFTYTSTHLLATMRGPRAFGVTATPSPVVSMTWDAAERVTAQTDQLGRTTTFTYGPASSPSLVAGQTLVTDPAGHQRLDSYTDGLLTSQTRGYGTASAGTWSYTYDPITLGVTTASDPKGNLQTYSYDDQGNRLTESDARGYTTSHTYDALGNLTSTITPDGVRTLYRYDEAGHIAKAGGGTTDGSVLFGLLTSTVTQALGQPAEIPNGNPPTATSRTVNTYYDDAAHPGDLTRLVDPRGKTTTSTYDAAGNVSSVSDPLGHVTRYGHDTAGRKTSEVSPRGVAAGVTPGCTPPSLGCTSYAYDAWGNPIRTTDALNHTTFAAYDADGHRTSTTDGNGRTTTATYDQAGQQTAVTRADGTTLLTHYNPDSTVKDTVDGAGNVTSYGYDDFGRQTSRTDPRGRTSTVVYDKAGHASTFTDPLKRVTSYAYDPSGHLASVSHSDGTTPNMAATYDAMGRRVSRTDGTGTSTWSYDDFGQVVSQTNGAGSTVGYAYDAAGNLTSLVYPGSATNVLARTFDDAGRLTGLKDWNGNAISFGYDEDGNVTSTTNPNGTVVTNTLDDADQLASTGLKAGATVLASLAATRDAAGQLSGETVTGVPGGNRTFSYTSLEQVASSGNGTATDGFAYDAADNPTKVGATTQSFDAANQLCWSATGAAPANQSCTTAPTGATSYAFDGLGERTTATAGSVVTSYGYDQDGRLTSLTGGGSTASYAYDSDGLRSAKTVNGTTTRFTWDFSASLLSDGTTSYLYGPEGAPVAQITATGSQWYFSDGVGSTRALTDAAGAVVGAYAYTAYGTVQSHTGTATTPLQFTGQYTDGESGLIYLRARFYDPATAQFLTVDPAVRDTLSPYGYLEGNPLNGSDPSGLCGFWCKVGVGTLIGAAVVGTVACIIAEPCGVIEGGALAVAGGGAAAFGVSISISGTVAVATAGGATAGAAISGGWQILESHSHSDAGTGSGSQSGGSSSSGSSSGSNCSDVPRLDSTGKVHGDLPDHVPGNWTRQQLEDLEVDLQQSIRTRQEEQLRLGEDAAHRRRINDETGLLRQIQKVLSGS